MNLLPSLCLAALAVAVSPVTVGAAVVGKIADLELTTAEVREILTAGGRPAPEDPAVIEQVVRAMLLRRMVLRQALDEQWDQRPEVAARLARARETELAECYLDAQAEPPPGYPADAEIAAAYEARKAALAVPKSYHLARIHIADDGPRAGAPPAAVRKLAAAVRAPGADFTALARANGAEAGGDLGWLGEPSLLPAIRDAVRGAALGAIVGPLRLDDGWYLLKVLDIREPHTPSLPLVRKQLRAALRAEQSHKNRTAYLDELLRKHPGSTNQLEISRLAGSSTEPPPTATSPAP